MSVSIEIKAYAGKDSKEFQKHFKAVQFCLENDLSYPVETSNFFKGKLDGSDLEDIKNEYILQYIVDGVQVPIKITGGNEKHIKIADIPKEVDEIVIKLI